jgi:hypothetical protein
MADTARAVTCPDEHTTVASKVTSPTASTRPEQHGTSKEKHSEARHCFGHGGADARRRSGRSGDEETKFLGLPVARLAGQGYAVSRGGRGGGFGASTLARGAVVRVKAR